MERTCGILHPASPQAKLYPTLIFQFVEDIQNAELSWKWNLDTPEKKQ